MISEEQNLFFDNFPTGLLIIKNSNESFSNFRLEENLCIPILYMNDYAKSILGFDIQTPNDQIIISLKKFSRIESLENEDYARCPTYCDYKLNLHSFINNPLDNITNKSQFICEKFISNDLLIYVKVKRFKEFKLISLDNLLEEKKSIEKNMMKNIKNQFFITLSHELNNPLNCLVNIFEDEYTFNNNT